MKVRNLIILLVFTMFLVGISCVSAENIDEMGNISSSDVADDVISIDDEVADDTIESDDSTNSVDDEVISDGETTRSTYTWGDFKSEVENTSINTVELNRGNIAPSTSSFDQVSINHDITIVGGYGYYIGSASWSSAPKYNYIPIVTSGNNLNVKFENVTFQYLSNNIFIKLMGNGNYTFKNCIFDHINATGSHQSVIWLNYGHALIENCTFTNCKCSFGAVTNYYSSTASTANYARMTVKDSTFKDNYATTEPGAINNCGYLEVYDTTFENNYAVWWAGAIHTHMYANTTIVRSNFKNNLAGWNGGALYTYSYLKVVDSNFTGNTETTNTGGGAIGASSYGSNPTVIVENSKFVNNVALTGNGGAIFISSGTLNVNNSEFINNTALKLNGGAISCGSGISTITNSVFKYNSAVLGKGGAIYGGGNGRLTVDRCEFVNNTAKDDNSGHALSYSYTGNSNTAAYLNYTNNEFYGPNNGVGSVYAGNSYLNVVQYNNTISDYSNYTEPEEENDTNSSTNFISITNGTTIGVKLWNASLDGALGGTPLINGNYIYVPNGHNVYCYNINNGALLWNVSSQWGYFHELALHNNVIIAPCSWDKLYFINATSGALIQNESNIYQGSSIYAPLVVDDTIYISSEYEYDDAWIAVIEYVNGQYVYTGSILEINNVPYGEQGLLSQPVVDYYGNIWVNTVDGLICIDPYTYDYNLVLNGTYGKPVVVWDNIYTLAYDNRIYRIMDNYIVASDVVPEGLGNSLVFSDWYYVLFFVTDDGVLRVLSYDSYLYNVSLQLNPVSSNILSVDGVLYIGDDAGILWVIDESLQNNPILWAYDTGLGILGTPVIDDDLVFVGNDEAFYALSESTSRTLNVNNADSKLKFANILKTSKYSDILSSQDNELLTGSLNHIYVSVNGGGDGSSLENPTSINNAITANILDNTIVHLADGNYEISTLVTIKAKENITIVADNPGKVNISYNNNNKKTYLTLQNINNFTFIGINFKYTYSLMLFSGVNVNGKVNYPKNILIDKCTFDGSGSSVSAISSAVNGNRNLTISNCNFTSSNARFVSLTTNLADYMQSMQSHILGECIINITNCIFSNCSTDAVYLTEPTDTDRSPESVIKHYIDNCKFYNTGLTIAVGTQKKTDCIYEIRNCVFDNENGPNIVAGGILNLKNNTVGSDYAIQLGENAKVISPLTFRILNNESVSVCVNESVDIIGELVDDMGNRIYHAGLKLDVNDSEMTPVINSTTGLYVLSFAPENIGELPIGVKCSNIDELDSDVFYLTVKDNPELTINCTDASYGDIFKVNATLKEDVSSENIVFTVFDSNGEIVKTAEGKIDNGFASAEFEGLNVGEYIVEVASIEDENYVSSSKTMSFNITQSNATVDLSILNDEMVYVGDSITVQAVLPTNATGSVTFRLKGTQQIITVSGETATALFAGLSEGNYTVYATYSGDANYNPSEEFNTTFTVYKKDSEFYIYASDASLGETAYVYVYLPSDATGNITYYMEGSTPETLDVNEVYSINGLVVGKYSVRAVYSGDSNYNASEYTCTFEVIYDLELENDEFGYGDEAVVNITFPEKVNGNLGVIVDNDYSSPISTSVINGSAVFNLPSSLAPGEHTLALTFQGETHIETNVTITVVPKITSLDDLTTGDNTISLSLPSDATGNLTIRVDDEDPVIVPVVNGTASYDLNNLSAGEHEIYVAYEGNYPEFSDYKTVDVAKATPKSTINVPSSITAGKAVTVPINLPSDATGVVLIDVDGKKYYADIVKGVANVAIPSLTAGDKKLTYKYLGDDKYAPITGSATLKVTNPPAPTPKKEVVKLTLKKVNVKKSAKKLVITATLKINGKAVKGKKITFKFNKKTYTAKTNKKGVAKITVKKAVLKKLKVGKKVTYTAKYSKTTVKKSVKVKK